MIVVGLPRTVFVMVVNEAVGFAVVTSVVVAFVVVGTGDIDGPVSCIMEKSK